MQTRRVVEFVVVMAHISTACIATNYSLNGWYPYSEYTFSDDGSSSGQRAECAVYTAPLCYPGICESGDETIDIFVKRMVATTEIAENATNVWLLDGGPGAASSNMEPTMVSLYSQLNGTVNIYTMDHRGTGRSTFLDCVAAQTTTTGSPAGREFDPSEVAACAQALEIKYGDLAAFSITSAALDLRTLIHKFSTGGSSIVYGESYGTALAERLMHLDPPEVTGYVLDGVSTTSGAPPGKFEYFSTWEEDFGEVGDYFLDLCAEDGKCTSHFEKKSLSSTLEILLMDFDNNPNSTCATLVSNLTSDWSNVKPSFKLREALGSILNSPKKRPLIPPVVYRLNRCTVKDVEVLNNFFRVLNDDKNAVPYQSDAYYSYLLYYLIMFSELWESPSPSVGEMNTRFASTKLSDGSVYRLTQRYCAFSKEKSPSCDELNLGNYESNGIIYDRDQYWNKSAVIPSQASVLLLSSKLDPKTPPKYAEYLLDTLEGGNKELITFNYTTHVSVGWTFLIDNDFSGQTCGMLLFASYVHNGGNLENLDKSCMDEMPAFNMTVSIDYQYIYLSTEDVCDGEYNPSLRNVYQ